MTPEDHTGAIEDAIEEAREVNGIVEFEAGKVYRTGQIKVWKGDSTTPETMAAGIDGNGAILKWKENVAPSGNDALLYLQSPQYRGNSGFFIRNLTLDCGNNPIGSLANGGTGQLASGQAACDFGLRILGGEDFLIENVTVLRAAKAGIYVEADSDDFVRNCVFRPVMTRFGAVNGFQIFAPTMVTGKITNVTLENCYSHRNAGEGFSFDNADGIQMVGCGAEKNASWNIRFGAKCPAVEILGGYTEKGFYDQVADDWVSGETPNAKNIWIENADSGIERTIRILGGRMIGRFIYTTVADETLIHSYGHTPQGVDLTSHVPDGNVVTEDQADYSDNYTPLVKRTAALNNVRTAYHEIPEHYLYFKGIDIGGTTCDTRAEWQDALKEKYNVFLVLHNETSSDHTTDIQEQIAEYSMGTLIDGATKGNGDGFSGVLAFEPGKTYLVSDTILVEGKGNGAGAPIGIDGNGAVLRATGSGADNLLELIKCHNSNDSQNDHYGFWMRDLTLDSRVKFDSSLYLQDCKFFHVRDVTATGAKTRGVHVDAYADNANTDVYYGLFQRLAAIRNGNESNPAADGVKTEFDTTGAIRLANVGFADSDISFNSGHGLNAVRSALTTYRSRIEGNRKLGVYAEKTYSMNFINTRITVGKIVSTSAPETAAIFPEHVLTNTGWCGGLHVVGGEVRSQENREAASVPTGLINYDYGAGSWGLFQSMLHISNHAVVDPITMGTDTLIARQLTGTAPGGAEGGGS